MFPGIGMGVFMFMVVVVFVPVFAVFGALWFGLLRLLFTLEL